MRDDLPKRLDYRASCERLQALGLLTAGEPPPQPSRMPRQDDEHPLGVSFFRTFVGSEDTPLDLSRLALPRTFMGRSQFQGVSFRGCDLSESRMCWNDFVQVDFGEALLIKADLRASVYEQVCFDGADLSGADLRSCELDRCTFEGAIMKGTQVVREQAAELELSPSQTGDILWHLSAGDEPPGG